MRPFRHSRNISRLTMSFAPTSKPSGFITGGRPRAPETQTGQEAHLRFWCQFRFMPVSSSASPLKLFSVVIPAHNEEESLPPTLRDIYAVLSQENVPHE